MWVGRLRALRTSEMIRPSVSCHQGRRAWMPSWIGLRLLFRPGTGALMKGPSITVLGAGRGQGRDSPGERGRKGSSRPHRGAEISEATSRSRLRSVLRWGGRQGARCKSRRAVPGGGSGRRLFCWFGLVLVGKEAACLTRTPSAGVGGASCVSCRVSCSLSRRSVAAGGRMPP